MKPYFITLKNSKTDERFHRAVYWAVSFPEAAREAYYVRMRKGYDWSIVGVAVDTQWDAKHGNR